MNFAKIDIAINNFIKDRPIKVSKDPHSDWLVFDWRQLTWSSNEIGYLIEICPNFTGDEKISSWTLYTAAYYDLDGARFYTKKSFASETTIDFISANIESLLSDSYRYISNIPKNEIPFAVELSK